MKSLRVLLAFVPMALAGLAWTAGGCSSSSSDNTGGGNGDGGLGDDGNPLNILIEAGFGCAPAGAKNCVNDTLARVCPADGTGWLPVLCSQGQKCKDGTCQIDPSASCDPGDGACTSPTASLRCRDDGQGYTATTCPANTTCTGKGICRGACVLGDSYCSTDYKSVITCADGNSYTAKACAGDQLCVDNTAVTPSAGNRSAACVHAD
jgi:hypothetical protein